MSAEERVAGPGATTDVGPPRGDGSTSPPGFAADRWTLLGGLAMAVAVGYDGTLAWQIARVVVVVVVTAVALGACRRGGLVRRLEALLIGPLLLASGLGLSVLRLLNGQVDLPAVVGVVLVIAGVGLSGTALKGVGSRRPAVVRWVAVVPLVVVQLLIVWIVGPMVAATSVRDVPLGSRTPADVGLDASVATLESEDGVELSAWWVPGDGAAVILAHGSGSARASLLDHAAVLTEHGYGVLLLDARGHGDSEGHAMDLGWHGEADLRTAIDFVVDQPSVDADRVALLGLSMGGEAVIGAAGSDPRVAATVAEGATGRSATDRTWYSEEFGWRGTIQEGIEWAQTGVATVLAGTFPPAGLRESVAAAAPRPVLVIAAERVENEVLTAERLGDAAPDAVTVWVVPGADHIGALDAAPDEWEETVVGFLDDAIG